MAGADQYWHSSSKGVNIKFVDESLAFNETSPVTSFMSIGTMVIELREFKKKKKKKKDKM